MPKLLNELVHVGDGSTDVDGQIAGVLHPGQYLVYVAADLSKVLFLRHHIDVEAAAKLIVIDFGGRIDLFDRRRGFKRRGICGTGSPQRNLLKIRQRLDLVVRILDASACSCCRSSGRPRSSAQSLNPM